MKHKTQKKWWPTYLTQWVGKFAIRILPEVYYREPQVVFITRITKSGYLTGQILNSDDLLETKPFRLVPYSPRLFLRLKSQYRLRKARKVVEFQTQYARAGKYYANSVDCAKSLPKCRNVSD